jgi:hypothetical protein
MSEIITKYSDYALQTIEYFIETIEKELAYRDLPGLTNNKVEKINVLKEHPLVSLMNASINETRNADYLRSSIIPAISVTPGNNSLEGFTLGQSLEGQIVDAAFIANLQSFYAKTQKDRNIDGIITTKQIDDIISKYRRVAEGGLRAEIHTWSRNEEVNISVYSESADIDVLLGYIMDSIMAGIEVGFSGDMSKVKNMKYAITKGLTNFNFGRVLFGSEYNLTFTNTYNNYTIYTDDVLSGHDLNGTFAIPN